MKEILREIGKIYRCLDSISNIEFKQFDLAKGQYAYLVRICENPGIIQERIAEMLKVDRTTASRAIQKLQQSGFISKESSPENKKVLLLFPTKKGQEVYEILLEEENYTNKVALQNISVKDQKTLLSLLENMRACLEPDWTLVKKGGQRQYLKKFNKK
ncbi:MarR family transcriptional regulator [Clostridium carboxidivorans P7]|uniref:Transcriptional regulator, MarR family n=1 Tax=Clostridium carboxidivorans P7 TaxID=536227 RepID=C6PSS2_9CLOT|nr:MarR family transcriptional regulator [Clostridium carboxidivorans]AKN31628.1 MarR family transcriptional regulator [Clostridium carboxidivorans P7]EET87751.1 transcriptional regulator, MarR family [Clostridium carboxidivorans P7]